MGASPSDLIEDAAQLDEPRQGLRAVAALRRLLEQLEAAHVERALGAGWTWSQIADELGVSKQAVHQKYAKRLGGRRRTRRKELA
jgi:hypothetical protein